MSDSKIVLAIETSARFGGVAVVDSVRGVLAEEILSDGMKHGRLLLPAIDNVLIKSGVKLSELDAVAVSIGPGSYTGTRVGVIAGKSLAFAAGIKVIPVSSLGAMVIASECKSGIVVPMQYARSDELYTAVYEITDGKVRALVDDIALEPELVKKMIQNYSVHTILGSGIEKFEEDFEEYKGLIVFENSIKAAPASCVGLLALQNIDSAIDSLEVEPVYMRRDSSPCSFEKFQK